MQTLNDLKLMRDATTADAISINYLNIRVGSTNEYPLDILLMKGSPTLVKNLIQQGASPTAGWKYETLENFKANKRSVLSYLLNRGFHRTETEKQEISLFLEETLRDVEHTRQEATAKKIASATTIFRRQ